MTIGTGSRRGMSISGSPEEVFVVPEVPIPVFAVLDYAHGLYTPSGSSWIGEAYSGSIFWEGTGDSPPAGFPGQPTSGPLGFVAGGPGGLYQGIKCLAHGLLSVNARVTFLGVVGGLVTFTLWLAVNGVNFQSTTVSSDGGLRGFGGDVTVATGPFAIGYGDVLSMNAVCTGSWPHTATVPAGVGSGEQFQVSGTLAL